MALAPDAAKQRLSQKLEADQVLYAASAWRLKYRLRGFINGDHFQFIKFKRYSTGVTV